MLNFELLATCPEEIKSVVEDEVKAIGGTDLKMHYKAISFFVDEPNFYRAHLRLACVSNLYRIVKKFRVESETHLFLRAAKIHWTELFDVGQTFRVDGSTEDRGRGNMGSNVVSKKVREGIQDHFMKKEGRAPQVDLKDPDIVVMAHMSDGVITIGLNSAGQALHRRGYRTLSHHPAPLKETLAAAILRLVGFDGSQTLLDPFCGSGTFVIEAAMQMLGIPSNVLRPTNEFAFSTWKDFNPTLWNQIKNEDSEHIGQKISIYGSDIDSRFIEEAKASSKTIGVDSVAKFSQKSFFSVEKPAESGILIANLPYGERLLRSKNDMEDFYKSIGDHLKKHFTGWRAALLVAEDTPWKLIGLKTSRRIPILNGPIKAKLLIFDLYAGTKKFKHPAADGEA